MNGRGWLSHLVSSVRIYAVLTVIFSVIIVSALSLWHVHIANAEEAQDSFESAKAYGEKTSFERYDIYTMIMSQDATTKKNQVVLYGELKMPYTCQDLDVEDHDSSYFKANPYMTSFFEWDSKHAHENRYDNTIFKANMQPFALDQGKDTLLLTIDGEEVSVKVQQKSTALNTKDLEGALTEHENEYQAVKSAGMKITPDTERAFLDVTTQARSLLDEAKKEGSKVTQQQLDEMRATYNESFARLMPEPFDRTHLRKALDVAQKADGLNGKDGKRYKQEGYQTFSKRYAQAKKLEETEDLRSAVGPRENGITVTHRDFETTPVALEEAVSKLELEDYVAPDTARLMKAYHEAVAAKPSDGMGFTKESAQPHYEHLTQALYMLHDVYATQDDMDKMADKLNESRKALVSVPLNPVDAFDLVIKYRHPMDDAPSAKIDEYFEEGGKQIEVVMKGVLPGQEVRIPLKDYERIKRFEGYNPTSFFYAANDTSTDTVRVLRDEDGEQFILFTAEKHGGLDVKYLKGADTRDEMPAPTPEPNPDPAPQPEPSPHPDPQPDPTPSPTPEPAPQPEPAPSPVPQPEPTPSPAPQPGTSSDEQPILPSENGAHEREAASRISSESSKDANGHQRIPKMSDQEDMVCVEMMAICGVSSLLAAATLRRALRQ